jgi:hypothetical protein
MGLKFLFALFGLFVFKLVALLFSVKVQGDTRCKADDNVNHALKDLLQL